MICTRTVLLTAFSTLILAPSASWASAPDRHRTAVAPCDVDPLDGNYDPVAFRIGQSYFPDDAEAAPGADAQAEPDQGDEAEQGDDPSADEGDEDTTPDGDGCAEITLAPYDFVVRPPEASPRPVMLRRRFPVSAGSRS